MNKEYFIEKIKSKIEQVDEYGAMGIRQDSLLDLEEWVDLLLNTERDRCAKIADDMDIEFDKYDGTHEQIVYSTQAQIAKTIRDE